MENLYCPHCEANRGFKRALGFGTIIMIFLTCGLWLFTLPLYPKRCIQCGGEWSDAKSHRRRERQQQRLSSKAAPGSEGKIKSPPSDGKFDIGELFGKIYTEIGVGGIIVTVVIFLVLFGLLRAAF